MFTVRHDRDDGEARLYTALQVQFMPMTKENGDVGGLHMLAGPHEAAPGIAVGKIQGGIAYVMNQVGKTVATFDMRQPARDRHGCAYGQSDVAEMPPSNRMFKAADGSTVILSGLGGTSAPAA